MKIKSGNINNWWAIWFEVGSDYDDEFDRNQLAVYGFGKYWYITFDKLWFKPQKHIHNYKYSVSETEFREGSYQVTINKRYGFSLTENNFFQLFYGPQTGGETYQDEVKEKRKSWFLPWTSWHFTYHKLLNLDRTVWKDFGSGHKLGDKPSWEYRDEQENMLFLFADYDGEEIIADVALEERRWDLGEGKFQWLKYFSKPRISTSLDIKFSSEVGKKKGSWKGGTIGHGIDIEKNESVTDCFKRYCKENDLTFIRELVGTEREQHERKVQREKFEREKRYQESKAEANESGN